MTHSGGKPHNVGTGEGMRFAVTFLMNGERKTFGHSNTMEGCAAMLRSIELHPSMTAGEIVDRDAEF